MHFIIKLCDMVKKNTFRDKLLEDNEISSRRKKGLKICYRTNILQVYKMIMV